MVAIIGGMLARHQKSASIGSGYNVSAEIDPFHVGSDEHTVEQAGETTLWPPLFTLILAACLSALLWFGILDMIIGAHRILGWF
jgi:hypothetical protein